MSNASVPGDVLDFMPALRKRQCDQAAESSPPIHLSAKGQQMAPLFDIDPSIRAAHPLAYAILTCCNDNFTDQVEKLFEGL
jgi:hypothetical protein